MKLKIMKYFLSLVVLALCAVALLYALGPKSPEERKTVKPQFATSTSCGDPASKKSLSQILDLANVPSAAEAALRENASAIPGHIVELLERNKFKISAKKEKTTFRECQYNSSSVAGRTQICVEPRGRKIYVVLRDEEKGKYTASSQISEALLPSLFSLTYDHFWPLAAHEKQTALENKMKPSHDQPFDASEKPLTEFKKFVFWRYSAISKLNLFSNPTDPYIEFDGSGNFSPSFVRRSLNLFSTAFYCRPDSQKQFLENQPDFYKEFSESLACVLGKPWFMKDEEFNRNCPSS
jgi:hypothetical protein